MYVSSPLLCLLISELIYAYLTQNTRPMRLATSVNRTYNQTNRGRTRVPLGPFECIRESSVCFF